MVPRRQLCSTISNKTISANNTPSVSPCSSPTIIKKDVFAKITAFTINKNPIEPTIPPPLSAQHHIHRHHRNTSTVSQTDTILTTQPSTQSIAACNSISDQSYSSINKDSTTSSSNSINNGTVTYPPPQRHQQPVPSSTSTTSESMKMELSPSIVSNSSTSSITSPSPNSNQWRHKLTNLKQSFQNVGTPRFHRRAKVLSKFILYHFFILVFLLQ
jgi:hypothetical protein